MAWLSSGLTNRELVENLKAGGVIKLDRVVNAMKDTDRAHYVSGNPYQDSPQSIGWDATISAPHMHAHSAEYLESVLQPGANVLDIGCGSGYLMAMMARMVQPEGTVTGIEHIPQLVELSKRNLQKDPFIADLMAKDKVRVVLGDGRKGYEKYAPYNAIHVGAAAESLHQPLLDQLANKGKMFIPVSDGSFYGSSQYMFLVQKDEKGNITKDKKFGVMYVGLKDPPPQS